MTNPARLFGIALILVFSAQTIAPVAAQTTPAPAARAVPAASPAPMATVAPEKAPTPLPRAFGRGQVSYHPTAFAPYTFDNTIVRVRFDFARGTLTLARNASSLNPRGSRLHIALEGQQPEVDGEFDGIRGRIAIDTGSMSVFDVMSPVVRSQRLIARYGASQRFVARGIGGTLESYRARVRTLRLGNVVVRNVETALDTTEKGAMADPTIIGNVGVPSHERIGMALDGRGRGRYWEAVRCWRWLPWRQRGERVFRSSARQLTRRIPHVVCACDAT